MVFDQNVANRAHLKSIRGRIAYMPQGLGRNLYPTLSVLENIDFFGRLFGQSASERRTRITELLTATALDPFEDRPAGKLSGGMKQKLSLCCALINDPDLLILDEPTTGVDPLSRGQFWDLINTIRARRPQMSVMVATAYMDEAQRFDWLMAMDDGKIIAHGTFARGSRGMPKPRKGAPSRALSSEASSARSAARSKAGEPFVWSEQIHCPDCTKRTPTHRHVWSESWRPRGGWVMTYDANAAIELELERLRFRRQRYAERSNRNQEVTPAIKMIIGDWYVDELGMPTREIAARD